MKEREIVLQILGMHCAACAQGIESGLARLDGIIDAKVNFAAKEAIVKFDEEKVTQDQTEPFLGLLLQCHNDPLGCWRAISFLNGSDSFAGGCCFNDYERYHGSSKLYAAEQVETIGESLRLA